MCADPCATTCPPGVVTAQHPNVWAPTGTRQLSLEKRPSRCYPLCAASHCPATGVSSSSNSFCGSSSHNRTSQVSNTHTCVQVWTTPHNMSNEPVCFNRSLYGVHEPQSVTLQALSNCQQSTLLHAHRELSMCQKYVCFIEGSASCQQPPACTCLLSLMRLLHIAAHSSNNQTHQTGQSVRHAKRRMATCLQVKSTQAPFGSYRFHPRVQC